MLNESLRIDVESQSDQKSHYKTLLNAADKQRSE